MQTDTHPDPYALAIRVDNRDHHDCAELEAWARWNFAARAEAIDEGSGAWAGFAELMAADASPWLPLLREEAEAAAWDDHRRTRIETWFERDRSHVALIRELTGETITQWWDEDCEAAFEDGFLDGRDLHGSARRYARSLGLLR